MALSQIPSPSAPLVTPETGRITVPWFQFFLRLIAQLLPEGVAPATAEYLVAAPHAALPNARVATDSPTVTVDVSVPGVIRWHAAGGSGPALPSPTGGYALTGSDATLPYAGTPTVLPTDVGTYALTGSDAALSETSAPVLLPTDVGTYALTGSAATVSKTSLPPPIALVTSLATGPGGTGGTTSALDTTGADFLLLHVAWHWSGGASVTGVSDSKGNTWVALTQQQGNDLRQKYWYCFAASVGTGHTFTVAASGTPSPMIAVLAFSGLGAGTQDRWVGNGGGAVSPMSIGMSMTAPSANGALLVSAASWIETGLTITPPSGLSTVSHTGGGIGASVTGAAAWVVQPTAASTNLTWSWTGGTVSSCALANVAFLQGP